MNKDLIPYTPPSASKPALCASASIQPAILAHLGAACVASLNDPDATLPPFCAFMSFESEDQDGDGLHEVRVLIDPSKIVKNFPGT